MCWPSRGDARRGRARAVGDGPTFIEAVTYRAAPHATADDPAFTSISSASRKKRNECVGRYERYLKRLGVLDEAVAEQIRAEAADVMRRITEAEAEPPADVSLVFDHAHADRCRSTPTSCVS